MKVILVSKSGSRYFGDTLAMIYPESPANITGKYELKHATADELQRLKDNPYDDELLQTVTKRNNIR